jgi:drug/metabolite transporter (DMT)-like permease
MHWIVLSLGSSFGFAIVSALDKILIQRYMPTPLVFIVIVGLCQLGLAAAAVPFSTFSGYGVDTLIIAIGGGLLSGIYLAMMFWVMRTQDVSRVVPVTTTHTIFVAILAMVFLSEFISLIAWIGILATVGGAALMSLGPTMRESEREQNRIIPFMLLLVASLAFGINQFLTKLISVDMDVWTLFMWRALGMGISCTAFIVTPRIIPDLIDTLRSPIPMGLTILVEGVLVLGTVYITLEAIYAGPVSLVTAVMATRPMFVFLLGIILSLGISRVLDEPLGGKILAVKLAAIALTVGGVAAVSIN